MIEVSENENPWHVWLECVTVDGPSASLTRFDKQNDILLFLKFFNPYSQIMSYCGHIIVPIEGTTVSI